MSRSPLPQDMREGLLRVCRLSLNYDARLRKAAVRTSSSQIAIQDRELTRIRRTIMRVLAGALPAAVDWSTRTRPTVEDEHLLSACRMVAEYWDAVDWCNNDPERMDHYCTHTGETLDLLYLRWAQECRKVVNKDS
jgi:hypothetical protein